MGGGCTKVTKQVHPNKDQVNFVTKQTKKQKKVEKKTNINMCYVVLYQSFGIS